MSEGVSEVSEGVGEGVSEWVSERAQGKQVPLCTTSSDNPTNLMTIQHQTHNTQHAWEPHHFLPQCALCALNSPLLLLIHQPRPVVPPRIRHRPQRLSPVARRHLLRNRLAAPVFAPHAPVDGDCCALCSGWRAPPRKCVLHDSGGGGEL